MSFDIAKYPTLALVDSTQGVAPVAQKRACRSYVMSCGAIYWTASAVPAVTLPLASARWN
ncbi:hypothetical protein LNQ03_10220 [Klebsiella pneumoniae subsp. pneumoniae]|nr:hypothetical protein [Klebsiella pneumoniae subsp. pneumoniae]